MRRARRDAACALTVVALAITAGAAHGQSSSGGFIVIGAPGDARVLEQRALTVTPSGAVAVSFHGDDPTGCRAAGSCGVSGTVVWTPGSSGFVSLARYRVRGKTTSEVSVLFAGPGRGAGVTAAVRRRAPDGTTQSCADAYAPGYGSLAATIHGDGDRARIRFTTGDGTPGLDLTTRCAGPALADVAGVLPSVTTSLRALRRGRLTLSLASDRSFAAHGLAGTVVSTLSLRLGRSAAVSTGQRSPSSAGARHRSLQVDFDVARLEGAATATVGGTGPGCSLLDACGLTGTVTARPSATHGRLELLALAPARVSGARLRAAVGLRPGARPRGVEVVGGGIIPRGGSVTAALSRPPPDDAPCSDDTVPAAAFVSLVVTGGRLRVDLGGGQDGLADPLRTRCPGPTSADVLGAAPLASGSVPLSALRHATVTVDLARSAAYATGGYRGDFHAALRLVLRRRSVTEHVYRGG
jgi:hypothetical protein